MPEHTSPQAAPDLSPARPAPHDAPPATHDAPPVTHEAHERGPTPTGTFGVIGLLLLSISTLWLLVLGILEGRA